MKRAGAGVAAMAVAGAVALAAVLGIAMIANMAIAAVAGAAIPLFLRRIGRDPAQASAILLTAVTDVAGSTLFLGLAMRTPLPSQKKADTRRHRPSRSGPSVGPASRGAS